MKFWLPFFLATLGLVGCSHGEPSDLPPFILQLHLPSALSRTEPRWAAFKARVRAIEVQLHSARGEHQTVFFAPSEWEKMQLPPADFPEGRDDSLSIKVRVWDTQADGLARPIPALSGRARLAAQEVAVQGPTFIHVRLALRVPIADYSF